MPNDIVTAWDRHSAAYQDAAKLSTSVAHYGPDIATEADLRLLGDLKGKKVLELGCDRLRQAGGHGYRSGLL